MEAYINCKKTLYNSILEFLEESNEESQQCFDNFYEIMKSFHIEGDKEEMTQFLLTIKNISDHHHRDGYFIKRVKEIFHKYKEQIKQTLSNEEIFHIFENNKLIVHFLLKNNVINIAESIYNDVINKIEFNGNRYCHFFYPELEAFKGEDEMKGIKEELLSLNSTAFDHFEEKRQEGENDSYICSLIRNDSVEEFIAYINYNKISISSQITPSIFETNSFLINNKNTTLIEYSAFFGSIQIFQYLRINNVNLTSSLWLYSIHSKNPEFIHLLESDNINPPKFLNKDNNYLACLIESIKCHHNDFSEYIENNLIHENETESKHVKKEILNNCLKYHNYSYFQTDTIKEQGFSSLCFYNYYTIVDLLLKEKKNEIEKKIIIIIILIKK